MKKLILSVLMICCIFQLYAQQNIVRVLNANTSEPIPSAIVQVDKVSYFTDENGEVAISCITGESTQVLVSKSGFDSNTVISPCDHTVTTIQLKEATRMDNLISLDSEQLQDDENDEDAGVISSMLGASRDPFANAAAFSFGTVRFKTRGYNNDFTDVYVNGLPMKTLHNSRVPFNIWGGLNDVFRNKNTVFGMDHTEYAFGHMNGATNIDISAKNQRKQTRISYAISNRTYRNRLMATHNSGMSKNGWAYSLSVAKRWAKEGYVAGTFYNGYSYFASLEKRLSERNHIGLSVFGSPIHRGSGSGSVEQVYDLVGSNYYNPNWGYLNGKKRNARNWKTHIPMIVLKHEYKPTDRLNFTQSLGMLSGRSGQSRLDWYKAPDPRPDYYRYLPSFTENNVYDPQLTKFYKDNPLSLQLNWNRLFDANRNNVVTLNNVNNTETITGKRSLYAIKEDRQDLTRFMYNAHARYELTSKSALYAGFIGQYEQTAFFQSLDNLLGGDFWFDINQFVERDFPNDPNRVQSDLNNPNRIVKEGDKYGYHYLSQITDLSLWTSYKMTLNKLDMHVGLKANYTALSRNGQFKNGGFPDQSEGLSKVLKFITPAVKFGLNYKINGRNYIYANTSYQQITPDFRNVFMSPRYHNEAIEGTKPYTVYGGEMAYVHRSPRLKFKTLGYLTQVRDLQRARSFYIDGTANAFVNFITKQEGRTHIGVETAAEWGLTSTLSLKGAVAFGQHYVDKRPVATIIQDNSLKVLEKDVIIYAKNMRLPGAQAAYSAGITYNSPKFWFASLTANYFDHMYLDYNPIRRTTSAVESIERNTQEFTDFLKQTRLNPGFTLDFFGGYSYRIAYGKFVRLNVGVNNILDNTELRTGGFEQTRLGRIGQTNSIGVGNKFPNRYFYAWGRNYFISLTYQF